MNQIRVQFFDKSEFEMPERYVPRSMVTYTGVEKLERGDNQLRGILLKPPQIVIFLQQAILKPFFLYRTR